MQTIHRLKETVERLGSDEKIDHAAGKCIHRDEAASSLSCKYVRKVKNKIKI